MTTSDATQQQILASKPDISTWLSANAGSGKTKVLTDRVARLLLNGTLPERILCLTYTKAAANEMQNRLFSRLGSWSMMPDTELRENLLLLGLPDSNISTKYLSTRYHRSAFRHLTCHVIDAFGKAIESIVLFDPSQQSTYLDLLE